MRLYYTTTAGLNEIQKNSVNSIGGYKSSTPVMNDVLDNLFGELSLYGMKQSKPEYKALVLINEDIAPVNKLEFWFSHNEEEVMYCDYSIALVTMSTDSDGNPVMETSPNYLSKPFYATFFPATELDKISIDIELEEGGQLGLWICRTPNKAVIIEDYDKVAEPDIEKRSRFKRIQKLQEETSNLNVSWENVIPPTIP